MKSNLLERFLEMEEENDSIQVGSSSERVKVYLNLDDPKRAKRKIENAIGLREYVRMIEDEEGEEDRRELMEKFLGRANGHDEEDRSEEEGEEITSQDGELNSTVPSQVLEGDR